MITPNETNNDTAPAIEKARDKPGSSEVSPRQPGDTPRGSGDTANVSSDRPVRTMRDANESNYDAASRRARDQGDRVPIMIDQAEFVDLSDENRQEAIAALTTLLAPLAARLTRRRS